MEGHLIAELPNAIEDGLNEKNDNCTIIGSTRRETNKKHGHTVRNKRSRGPQKCRKQRNKKSPNRFNAHTILKIVSLCDMRRINQN